MAGVFALAPLDSAAAMQALRYRLLSEGRDIACFHAAEDRQEVRNRVFNTFAGMKSIRAHVIYGDKRRAAPRIQSDSGLHSLFGRAIIRYAMKIYRSAEYEKVVVIFDQALTKKKQGEFHGIVKPELKALGKPFHVYFQKMVTDMNGQVADYVAWSKFVSLERDEERPWQSLARTIQPSDFDIFRRGRKFYY